MKVYYNKKLKALARELRNKSTLSEVLLWNELKRSKMRGYDFHRQKPVGNFIVDFYCFELRLIIEIDGASHIDKVEYDSERQKYLESVGFYVMRFDDREPKTDMVNVLRAIGGYIDEWEEKHTMNPPETHP
ncbi:MAG: DUF559 domain-containing protein [Bacteroidota bacterium]